MRGLLSLKPRAGAKSREKQMSFGPSFHRIAAAFAVVFTLADLRFAAAQTSPRGQRVSVSPAAALPKALRALPRPRVHGVALEQSLFRSSDGTVYQLLRALPEAVPIDADAYVVTQVAAGVNGLELCSSTTRADGSSATVGADTSKGQVLHSQEAIRRTAIFSPSDIATVAFDEAGSGRLSIGRGLVTTRVCKESADCPDAEPLVPFTQEAQDGLSGCLSNGVVAACGTQSDFLTLFGFRSLPDGTDSCATEPATKIALCGVPPGGLRLEGGEAVVLVFQSDLRFHDFTAAVAAFAVNEDGNSSADCPVNTVVSASTLSNAIPSRLP